MIFNTGAAQKYVEAIRCELPRLDVHAPIDWERVKNGEGTAARESCAVEPCVAEPCVVEPCVAEPCEATSACVEEASDLNSNQATTGGEGCGVSTT